MPASGAFSPPSRLPLTVQLELVASLTSSLGRSYGEGRVERYCSHCAPPLFGSPQGTNLRTSLCAPLMMSAVSKSLLDHAFVLPACYPRR